MMKRRRLWIFAALCAGFVLALMLLGLAGYWLQVSDTPQRSDAIIVLAGDPLRALYAADLFNQHYAPQVYVSKPVRHPSNQMLDKMKIVVLRDEEIYRQVLLRKGVPYGVIHLFGHALLNTIEESEAVKKIFKKSPCRLLIVTSPYHVRRTRMIFKDRLPYCEVRVARTPYEPFPVKWWASQASSASVLLELSKILFYKAGGRFRVP